MHAKRSGWVCLLRLSVFMMIIGPIFGALPVSALEVRQFAAEPASGPAPLEVKLDVTTVSDRPMRFMNAEWDFGDGATATGFDARQTVTHIYQHPGRFTPKFTFVELDGTPWEISATVDVGLGEPSTDVAFSAEAIPNRGIAPLDTTFLVTVSEGTPPFRYIYNFGDGSSSIAVTAPSISHTYSETGDYDARITVLDADANAAAITVRVSVVSEAFVHTVIEELSKDRIVAVPDLQNLQNRLTPIVDRFDRLLDYVKDRPATDPIRIRAENTATETVDRILEQQADAMQPIVSPETRKDDVVPVLENTGRITRKIVASDIGLTLKALAGGTSISGLAFQAILDDVLAPKGISESRIQSLLADPEQAREFLSDPVNASALGAMAESAVISVGSAKQIRRDTVSEDVIKRGYSPAVTDAVKNALAGLVDVQRKLLQQTDGGAATGQDFVEMLTGGIATVDSTSGTVTNRLPDGAIEGLGVAALGIRPDSLPPGLFTLPDGTRVGVMSGFVFNFSPAAADPVSIAAEIAAMGLKTQFTPDGRLIITDPGANLSISFGMSYTLKKESGFQAGTVSFSVVGSDPAARAFSLLVNYGDGTTQSAPTMILAKEPLLNVFEALFPGQYALDLNTGILEISGVLRLKPDFAFERLTAIDYASIQSGGGLVFDDVAFEIADFNNDGRPDLRYYSPDPMGRQILYAISD